MSPSTRRLISGPAGAIEVLIDTPESQTRGLALIAHPHPLYGGTNENKVVQTLARAFVQLGYTAWRPNFRGIGGTEGAYDEGRGETEDIFSILQLALQELKLAGIQAPPILAGFSFGSFVQTKVAKQLERSNMDYERLVLVGTATTRFTVENVRADTIIIHGEKDETISLADVMEWVRPQGLAITIVPDADHFFHRKLITLKQIILNSWGHPYSQN